MSATFTLQPHIAAEGKRVRWLVSEQGKSKFAKDCPTRADGIKVLRATVIDRLTNGVKPITAHIIEQSGYTETATYATNDKGRVLVTEHKTTPPKEGAGLGPRCRELGTTQASQSLRRRTLRSRHMWSDLFAALAGGKVYAIPASDGAIERFTTSTGRGAVRLGAEHFVIAQVAVIRDVPGARDLGAFPTYAEPPAGGLLVPQEHRITAPAQIARPRPPARPVAARERPRERPPRSTRPVDAFPQRNTPEDLLAWAVGILEQNGVRSADVAAVAELGPQAASVKVKAPAVPKAAQAALRKAAPKGVSITFTAPAVAPAPPAPPAPPKPVVPVRRPVAKPPPAPPAAPTPPPPREKPVTSKERPVRTAAAPKPPKERKSSKADEPSGAEMTAFLSQALEAFAAQKGLG